MKISKKIIFALFGLFCVLRLDAGLILSENGNAKAEIVTGKAPSAIVQFAAKELAEFLGRAGNCKIAVKESSTAPVRIYLGDTPETRKAGIKAGDLDHRIVIRKDGAIFLTGKDDPDQKPKDIRTILFDIEHKGTLNAVYLFLEKYIGVRWLEPGKAGEYVPVKNKLEVSFTDENHVPAFEERRCYYFRSIWATSFGWGSIPDLKEFGNYKDGMLWGLRLRYTGNYARVYGCHTPGYLHFDRYLYPKHPEWFALQADGSRSKNDLCWSHPEVEELWYTLADSWFRGDANPRVAGIDEKAWNPNQFTSRKEFMIDPHDYSEYYCLCKNCMAYKKPYGENGQGELVFKVISRVAERIRKKYPDRYITTLVYPPKRFYPKSVKIPDNVRVRITYPWVSTDPDSKQRKDALILTQQWNKQTQNKAYLWLYLCASFGNQLYGVPEVVPHLMQKLFQDVRPFTKGIFLEHIEPTHTMRNIDLYMLSRLFWNPDVDLEPLLDEYFQYYFGKAAPEMREFYNAMETKWTSVLKRHAKAAIDLGARPSPLLKAIFDDEYKYTEIIRMDNWLNAAIAKVGKNSIYGKRIDRYRRNVLQLVKDEFSVHSSDKKNSFKQEQYLPIRKISGVPSEKDWDAVPWVEMTPDTKKPCSYKSEFKVLISKDTFYLRGRFAEPEIRKSLTKKDAVQGKWLKIWEDNDAELFFAGANDSLKQLMINDLGVYAMMDLRTKKLTGDVKGVTVKTKRNADSWEMDVAVSNTLTGFSPQSRENRFNITRIRHIKGAPESYAIWSKDCFSGRWVTPQYYSKIAYIPVKKQQYGFQGKAVKSGNAEADMMIPEPTRKYGRWNKWIPPRARAVLGWSRIEGYSQKGAYMLDYAKEDPASPEFPSSWNFTFPVSAVRGKVLRITAWTKVVTNNPEALVFITCNWKNLKAAWYKGMEHPYGGKVAFKPVYGKWQKVSFEIPVPDIKEIGYGAVGFNCRDVRPGKFWFDDLKIEIVK